MKTSKKQNSNHPVSGFLTYFHKDGKFYFKFNDTEGKTIFYSQGYASAKSRDKGIGLVIKMVSDKSRFKVVNTDKGQYIFVLKAGNHQQIGRSILFDCEESLQKNINEMMAITEDTPIMDLLEVVVDDGPLPNARQSDPMTKNLPRHRFSLTYYPDSKIWQLKHDQSGTSREFKTFDDKLIRSFVDEYIPAERAKPQLQPVATPTPAVQEMEAVPTQLQNTSNELVKGFAKAATLKNMSLIPGTTDKWAGMRFYAKVVATLLNDQQQTNLIGQTTEQQFNGEQIHIPLDKAHVLQPGIYRFVASIYQQQNDAELLSGSQLVFVK